ncbi:SCAN domain-containing protein 3-like [Octopus sinensis]|uniref:SCAN domain-containing protein 3-like n=1 Tax=Octopus sinensis TaxID=2607531 RepID=A0A6P7S452_9MOLL|nr:SCAN domain-containing protein 3-like [Octopus sinensis]
MAWWSDFKMFIALNIPKWYSNTFEVDVVDCEDDVHEELIELQNGNDAIMRYRRKGKEGLWHHQSILNSYPNLWKRLILLLLAFPTSYLVESGFSHAGTLIFYKRIGLDVTQRGDLRLKLTSLKSNVSALAALHQTHSSH